MNLKLFLKLVLGFFRTETRNLKLLPFKYTVAIIIATYWTNIVFNSPLQYQIISWLEIFFLLVPSIFITYLMLFILWMLITAEEKFSVNVLFYKKCVKYFYRAERTVSFLSLFAFVFILILACYPALRFPCLHNLHYIFITQASNAILAFCLMFGALVGVAVIEALRVLKTCPKLI